MSPSTPQLAASSMNGSSGNTELSTPSIAPGPRPTGARPTTAGSEIPLPTDGRQPRLAPRSPPLCQRYMARLPAGADRRHSQVRRSAPIHHHKHRRPRLVRQLGPLRDHAPARSCRMGRLCGRGPLECRPQRRHARLCARMEAPELLGDGNAAGLGELGASKYHARSR